MARADATRIVAAMLVAATTHAAGAEGVRSPVPVAVRGRLNVEVVTAEDTAPWSWDAQSRSPLDGSRFMIDLTAGKDRTGIFYVKGASTWADADAPNGRVDFGIDQGDYLYRVTGQSLRIDARAFADERRYFTGELGTVTLDDDDVSRFQHRQGLRIAAVRDAIGVGYLASRLDEGDDSRILQRADARVSSAHLHAGAAYQHTTPPAGPDHALAQAEAATYFRRATAIVSYAHSGFGSGVFFPSQYSNGIGADVDTPAGAKPDENGAVFAEARLTRVVVTRDLTADAIYRYRKVGAAYVNDLAPARRGTESSSAGLYASAARYALDGYVVGRRQTRSTDDSSRRTLEASVRGFLTDNSEVQLRGGAERLAYRGAEESNDGFVHGIYRRELQRFMGGVQARLDGIAGDTVVRAAVETRVDWSPTSAFYARWIVSDTAGDAGTVYARIEFRTTARTWVTLAYGRDDVGGGAYLLDDAGLATEGAGNDVVTLTVRGDF